MFRRPTPMISYSVNHEDVLLDRIFDGIRDGFFVDIGAFHPVIHSITKHFSDTGWTGINVDPAGDRSLFAEHRPRDLFLPVAVADRAGEASYFDFSPAGEPELSTLSKDQADTHRQAGLACDVRTIAVVTLEEIFEKHVQRDIDFLAVDVEGHEKNVLKGGDWNRYRPKVVVVEATKPLSQIPCHEEWEPILIDADYLFAFFDGLNRYYVRRESSELLERFATPVNIFDHYVSAHHFWEIERIRRHYLEIIEELTTRLDGAGPASLALAKNIHKLAAKYPGLAEPFKKLLVRK